MDKNEELQNSASNRSEVDSFCELVGMAPNLGMSLIARDRNKPPHVIDAEKMTADQTPA